MRNTFRFEIVTPERVFYSADISSLVAPGTEGTFGVLANHAPLLARSNGGRLKVLENDQERFFQVGSGIVEVLPPRLAGANGKVLFFTKKAEVVG